MLNTIIKLLDAGYTKDEIQQMISSGEEKQEQPAPEPEPKKEAAADPAPEADKKESEPFDTQPFNKALDDLSKSLNAMNVKLQKMALDMYERPKDSDKKTVESIIAKIVDPGE